MKVDPQCYELAVHMMQDVKCASKSETTQELAKCIQELIEEFIAGVKAVESDAE